MTGVPTQLAIADLVLRSLRNSGEAPADADLPFFHLGAVSPALGDFLPTRVETAGGTNAPLFGVWSSFLGVLAGTPGSPPTPGLVANLRTLKDTLRRLGEAIDDEKKFELLNMKPELDALSGIVTAMTAQLAAINAARGAARTAIDAARPLPKVPPAGGWHPRDALHGHRTGVFWDELRRKASTSTDPRVRAFGLGVSVGYAGALCGNSFVNGVVGGPFRNHWWRHRWASHHIDAWVWGYYRKRDQLRTAGEEIVFPPGSGGRVPFPAYASWHNIPGAQLQDSFAIGGITSDTVLNAFRDRIPVPPFLPGPLVTLWLDAHNGAIGTPPSPGVNAAGLQGAYAMTWLTTWITSSDVFGTTPPDQIKEPQGCGPTPPWVQVDGSVVVGGTVVPPPPLSQPTPSLSDFISAIAAAILAGTNYLVGNVAAGSALLAAAVAMVDDETDPDWDQLRCHIGWVNAFVARLENAFRDLLAIAGLGPPYATALTHNDIKFVTLGDIEPSGAALGSCRSPSALESNYPRSAWSPPSPPGPSNWNDYPAEPPEPPRQTSYPGGPWWPSHFVDGWRFVDNGLTAVPRYTSTQDNPVDAPAGKPTVLDPGAWEERMKRVEQGFNPDVRLFGNAVDVALAVIRGPQDKLLDWDLGGDRGHGWPTWVWANPAGLPGPVARQ